MARKKKPDFNEAKTETVSLSPPSAPLDEPGSGAVLERPACGEGPDPLATAPPHPSLEPVPGTTWGRFQIQETLGMGGMGQVYRAHDTKLDRTVALKVLHSDDPQHVERLLREAKAQARVAHPNVCQVYEVGESGQRPFIVLPCIDGMTADNAALDMSLEEKVRIVLEAAEGLHAAHKLGLIHRDVKPGNIMVERKEDGSWRALVMDFGLVRDVSTTGLTMTGMVVGTPAFMAPEQARGDKSALDRRVDVYALGATLYTLVAGQDPFAGLNLGELIVALLSRDPAPLGKAAPGVPRDLETITQRCMEKDPRLRYESARALADDLRRFLDGEPILAQPPTIFYKLKKKIKKHWGKLAALSVAALLIASLLLLTVQSRRTAQEQARLAREFGREVERVEGALRMEYLSPLHDVRSSRSHILERMQWIRGQVDKLGEIARAPAAYAVGRGHLALGNEVEALKFLRQSWDMGYREPDVAYALGVTNGNLFERELKMVDSLSNKEQRERQLAAAEKRYIEPALFFLRQSRSRQYFSGSSDYLEALIAFYAKAYRRAMQQAESALKGSPWLFEAAILEGKTWNACAREARSRGNTPDIGRYRRAAIAAFRRATEIGRSHPATYIALAEAWQAILDDAVCDSGNEIAPFVDEVRRAADQALAAEPGSAGALVAKAAACLRLGEYQSGRGQDPNDSLEESLRYSRQAAAAHPDSFLAYLRMGAAYRIRAAYRRNHGQDAAPDLQGAAEAFRQASRLNPGFSPLSNNLGNT